MTSRAWTWTLNNYTPNERDDIHHIEDGKIRYLIYGIEVGESGTPHLQGYLELTSPQRMSAMKKLPGLGRAHFEVRRGTRDQARTYCMKDGEYFESGDWAAGGQGTRNDLRGMIEKIKANPTNTIEHMESDPLTYSKHQRFIEKYIQVLEKESTKDFRKVEVEVLHGAAGVGKTKAAHDADPNIFTVNTDEAFPFDGYNGEKTILLDDFYGGIKYHNLLRILDGHQLRVNIKGGSRYAQWTKVFITSNVGPSEWYKSGLTPALKRRLTTVTEFSCHQEAGNTEPPLDI